MVDLLTHPFLVVAVFFFFGFSSSPFGLGVRLLLYSHDLDAEDESISGGRLTPGSSTVDESGSPFPCSDSEPESDSESELKSK